MTRVAKESRIISFRKEMEAIHFANRLYWDKHTGSVSREARAKYARRQDRLEKIRRKLLDLKST